MALKRPGPLNWQVPIVWSDGRPKDYFIRWLSDFFQNDQTNASAAAAAQQAADDAVSGLDDKADKTTEIIAGDGLTGGGDLSTDRALNVGAGTGIIVNADDVAIDLTAEAERIRDVIGAALAAGTGITITVNDPGDSITIALDTTTEAERIRDVIGSALVAGSNVTITVNDGADTITIASTGGGGGTGSWIPAVTGAEPPVLLSDGAGHLILVAGP